MCFKKVCTTTLLDLGNLKEPLFAQLWDTSPLHWKVSQLGSHFPWLFPPHMGTKARGRAHLWHWQ